MLLVIVYVLLSLSQMLLLCQDFDLDTHTHTAKVHHDLKWSQFTTPTHLLKMHHALKSCQFMSSTPNQSWPQTYTSNWKCKQSADFENEYAICMALIDNRLITAFQMITYVSLFNLKIHEKGTCKTKEDGDDSRVLHAGQEKKGHL